MEFTAEQIAGYLGGEIDGNAGERVSTFSKIEEGKPGSLTFLYSSHYEHYLYETKASIVLVPSDFKPSQPVSATLIRLADPREAVARLLNLYEQSKPRRTGISKQAYVAESATVGKDCYIGPFAYIGDNVVIGDNTQIYPNSTIEEGAKIGNNTIVYPNVSVYHHCVIGSNVILHSGCVIGADGFGFAPTANGYEKIPQIGIVTIEDNVEIGANTCVDRSTMGSTYVRHRSKHRYVGAGRRGRLYKDRRVVHVRRAGRHSRPCRNRRPHILGRTGRDSRQHTQRQRNRARLARNRRQTLCTRLGRIQEPARNLPPDKRNATHARRNNKKGKRITTRHT